MEAVRLVLSARVRSSRRTRPPARILATVRSGEGRQRARAGSRGIDRDFPSSARTRGRAARDLLTARERDSPTEPPRTPVLEIHPGQKRPRQDGSVTRATSWREGRPPQVCSECSIRSVVPGAPALVTSMQQETSTRTRRRRRPPQPRARSPQSALWTAGGRDGGPLPASGSQRPSQVEAAAAPRAWNGQQAEASCQSCRRSARRACWPEAGFCSRPRTDWTLCQPSSGWRDPAFRARGATPRPGLHHPGSAGQDPWRDTSRQSRQRRLGSPAPTCGSTRAGTRGLETGWRGATRRRTPCGYRAARRRRRPSRRCRTVRPPSRRGPAPETCSAESPAPCRWLSFRRHRAGPARNP